MEVPWQVLVAVLEKVGFALEGGGPRDSQIVFTRNGEIFFHTVSPEGTVFLDIVLSDVEQTVRIGGVTEPRFLERFRTAIAEVALQPGSQSG
jgi:hypothetical protein